MNSKVEITTGKQLFQWEKERFIHIDPPTQARYAQFYNAKSKVALESDIEGGQALIPNELLMQNLPITVIICSEDGDGTWVIGRKILPILTRKKPETYIADDEEVILFGGNANGAT